MVRIREARLRDSGSFVLPRTVEENQTILSTSKFLPFLGIIAALGLALGIRSGTLIAQGTVEYSWPVSNPSLSQVFDQTSHRAIDIVSANNDSDGAPIYAAAEGVVHFVGEMTGDSGPGCQNSSNPAGGLTVVLNHPDGHSTCYNHLKGFAPGLSVDQHVDRGELIGYMGDTGCAFGHHLHFVLGDQGTGSSVPNTADRGDVYTTSGLWELGKIEIRDNPGAWLRGIPSGSHFYVGQSNLAKDQPVSVSSTDPSGNTANKVVDGDLFTRWASNWQDSDTQPSVEVDLGNNYSIDTLLLPWENYKPIEPWQFPAEGPRTVYAQYQDAAGNVSGLARLVS